MYCTELSTAAVNAASQLWPMHPSLTHPAFGGVLQVSDYWRMVIEINDYQKSRYVERVIKSMFNTVSKKKIAVSAPPQAASTCSAGATSSLASTVAAWCCACGCHCCAGADHIDTASSSMASAAIWCCADMMLLTPHALMWLPCTVAAGAWLCLQEGHW
jgi:hypothetical protein